MKNEITNEDIYAALVTVLDAIIRNGKVITSMRDNRRVDPTYGNNKDIAVKMIKRMKEQLYSPQ